MDRLIAFVMLELGNTKLNAGELAKGMGLSKAQLYRKIKAISGQSINIFVRNLRLDEAKSLLEEGGMSVSDIAYTVGFSDPNYFSRVFKERFGASPKVFQANS